MTERAELTPLIPGDPRMDRLPKGTCELSRQDGGLRIDHADPRIVISWELIDMIMRGQAEPEATIQVGDDAQPAPGWLLGAAVRFEAVNRTVVYRLSESVPWCGGWIAEWPD